MKGTHLEGGIRVPFLLKYGDHFEGNTSFNYPISTFDLLPTFVDAAGGNINSLENVDGVSLIPFLNGKNQYRPHETLYWKKETRAAIRDRDWKLIRMPDRPALLFNIARDPNETRNLARKHPEKVKHCTKNYLIGKSP